MSRFLIVIALLTAACSRGPAQQQSPSQLAAEMRTIDNVDPRGTVNDPPPMLTDEAPPPKPKLMPWETPTPIVMSPEDEKVRNALPFSPAIAMDPMNGDKISIRATTPTFEYKGKIYYFANEENRRLFAANPAEYTKSALTRL
jgi:YHS domain-containing protein